MLTVDTLIAVLSLILTSFGLGYTIGKAKNNRHPIYGSYFQEKYLIKG